MLLLAAIAACSLAVATLAVAPRKGILVLFAVNPLIAAAWSYRVEPFSLNHVIGVAVPILLVPQILANRHRLRDVGTWKYVASLMFVGNMIGVTTLFLAESYGTAAIYFIHACNGLLSFALLAVYIRDDEQFRHLIIAMLIGGLFPVGVGLYQYATGTVWQERNSAGIDRYVGLYHDAVGVKHFGLQTLLAMLLAFRYLKLASHHRILLQLYAVACIFVIFNAYSKSALAILVCWLGIWSMLDKRFFGAAVIIVTLCGVNLILDNWLVEQVKQLFWKEIAFQRGDLDRSFLLAGRVYLWDRGLIFWSKHSTTEKLFGIGTFVPIHNEYLRIMFTNGIVGLMIFVAAVGAMSAKMYGFLKIRKSPLQLAATMAFAMWMIDTIGVHNGLYSYNMWFVFGLMGLASAFNPEQDQRRLEADTRGG